MKAYYNILALLILTSTVGVTVNAQKLDVGLLLGGAYYYGDVVNELEPTTMRAAVGGFLRYRLGTRFAIKAYGGFNKVSGDDQLSESEWQKQRNWTFETNILEGSLLLEWNLIEDRNRGRRFANPFIPYLFGGVGMFNFTPKSDFNGQLQSLAPLQLSGVAYTLNAICMPFGFGARYYVARKFQIGFELGVRYTNTSYIDDIAPDNVYQDPSSTPFPTLTEYYYARSSANRNPGDLRSKMGSNVKEVAGSNGLNQFLGASDFYLTTGLTASYTIGEAKGGSAGGGRGRNYGKSIRCPRFY